MDDRDQTTGGESGVNPTSTTPGDPENPTELRAHNRNLLRRYIVDILEDGEMDVVHDIFHEDIEINTRDGRTLTGQEKVKEYLTTVRERFADLETDVKVIMATTTEAMAKFAVTAVHEDNYFGVDPANREVTFRVFSWARVEDGKMIDQGDIVNPLRMQPPSKRHGQFAVLEEIHDGVVVLDREEQIVEINPVAEGLLGVADRDVLNEPVQELVDGDVDLPGVGSSTEISLGDGQRIVDVSASSLTDHQDNRIGRILVLRDVTTRVRRRQQLEMLNRRNEHLDQVVSVVSHDLRNPLNVAKGRVQLARETGNEEHFDEIVAAHERIETIIEELLSSARSGMTLGETESISLAKLTEKVWETTQTADIALQTDVPADFTVDGDPNLFQHILENLFRNAADHNSPPVTVTVGTLDATERGRGFYVEDDGRGIPAENRQDVFEQGHTTDDDGTGLGLSIVREFVQIHGWKIAVTESTDGGARFEIVTESAEKQP